MTPHDPGRPSPEALELASAHALGGLDAAEDRAFEAHLDECRSCEAEVDSFAAVADELALAVPEVAPPPELLGRLMARVRAPRAAAAPASPQVWKRWTAPRLDGLVIQPSSAGGWERLSVPGIEVRRLFVDAEAGSATMLIRMAAGRSYPAHRHGGAEECFVLAGDIDVGDAVMREGDYQVAAAGSVHPVQSTAGGCLLLIRSSLHDELIEDGH